MEEVTVYSPGSQPVTLPVHGKHQGQITFKTTEKYSISSNHLNFGIADSHHIVRWSIQINTFKQ